MSEFSDQYFNDLPPRQRRYDTPVSDQLHFCVFPNGVKSWVFLYEVDGHVRRRTIGLFPDMGYREALRALDSNRRIAEVDASEQRQPAARPRISLTLKLPPGVQRVLRRISLTDVLTAAGTAVVALAVLMYLGRPGEPPPPEPTATQAPVARTEPPPAQPPTAQPPPAETRPAETRPAEPGPAEPRSVGPGSTESGGVAASTPASARPGPALPEATDPTRGTIRMAPPAPAVQEPDPVTAFEDDPAPADEGTAPAPDAAEIEAEIAMIDLIDPIEDLTPEALEEWGTTGTAAAVWAEEGVAQPQLLAAENEAAASDPVEPVADAGAPAGAAQDDGGPASINPLADTAATADQPADRDSDGLTVRRALLAGDVVDGQPRNTLSGTVTVPAGGELLIYFYIEFAESIGQPVTHRWLNGGAVEEESAMQVDSAAGAGVYTARLIGADRAGEWRVEAVTAAGRLLRGLDFTVVAAEEETPATTLVDEPGAEPDP